MSALEALKLIAPTAHLERRGGVEGGAEGGGAGREASFTVQDLAANSARVPRFEQTKDLTVSRSAHSVKFHIAHLPRGAPTWLNVFARFWDHHTLPSQDQSIRLATSSVCLAPCSRAAELPLLSRATATPTRTHRGWPPVSNPLTIRG